MGYRYEARWTPFMVLSIHSFCGTSILKSWLFGNHPFPVQAISTLCCSSLFQHCHQGTKAILWPQCFRAFNFNPPFFHHPIPPRFPHDLPTLSPKNPNPHTKTVTIPGVCRNVTTEAPKLPILRCWSGTRGPSLHGSVRIPKNLHDRRGPFGRQQREVGSPPPQGWENTLA